MKFKCQRCGKPFKNGIDNITGKVSQYIWEPTCDCNPNVRLCVG